MKKTFLYIIASLIFLKVNAQTPNWEWAKSAGSTLGDFSYSIAIDTPDRAVYITGLFTRTISFGSITLSNADSTGNTTDVFVVKYDMNGNVLWAKKAGGTGEDRGNSICVDHRNGNIIICGQYSSDSITFGNKTLVNSGQQNVFVTRYDSLGNVIWAKGAGGNNIDGANSVAVDPINGDVIVTGSFGSHAITFGTYTLTNT